MGYRGKLEERQRARELRAEAWTLQDIADELGVSKSSVSVWVRDVAFTPRPRRSRNHGAQRRPNKLRQRKLDEIARLLDEGRRRIPDLTEQEFLIAGVALYAGEGAKTDGAVKFANSDPRFIALFCTWLRHFFDIDESRLRVGLYLHQGLDLSTTQRFWSEVTDIPTAQFSKPYRAPVDASIRTTKHERGCVSVIYNCTRTHRAVMGLVHALLDLPHMPVPLPEEFGAYYGA